MTAPKQPDLPAKGQFLVYQAENGQVKIDVRLHGETAWLTQAHMADLFQTTVPNISMHLRNIFAEGELQPAATIQEFLTVRQEGNRSVEHYNLDAIISVGYRVKSAVATRFRMWATRQLREFIVKGFVLDDERLKNPEQPFDYFDESQQAPAATTQAEEKGREEMKRRGDFRNVNTHRNAGCRTRRSCRANGASTHHRNVNTHRNAGCRTRRSCRANGASTHQPRATPWELGHPHIDSP